MNVAAHQEKKNNEDTGRRKAGKERRQMTDFKKAACCPSAIVQGEGKPTAILTQPKRGRGPHHHVEVVVNRCS